MVERKNIPLNMYDVRYSLGKFRALLILIILFHFIYFEHETLFIHEVFYCKIDFEL